MVYAEEQTRQRISGKETQIVVSMGADAIAAGARDALAAIVDEVRKRGLSHVVVSETDGVRLCGQEPIVEVKKPGQPRVTYGCVTPERARQIIARHVVNDQITAEWVVEVR